MRLPCLLIILTLGLWSEPALADGRSRWFLPDVRAGELRLPNNGQILLQTAFPMDGECSFWLQSGRSRLQMEVVDDRAFLLGSQSYSTVVLRAKRSLRQTRNYLLRFKCFDRVESLASKHGALVQIRASGPDSSPPVWESPPSLYFRETHEPICGIDPIVHLVFSTPFEDDSQVWLNLTLWSASQPQSKYRISVSGEQITEVREFPKHVSVGECYHAIFCAVDAAGNESCASPIQFQTALVGEREYMEAGFSEQECFLPTPHPVTIDLTNPVEELWTTGAALALSGVLFLLLVRLRRRRRGNAGLGRLV